MGLYEESNSEIESYLDKKDTYLARKNIMVEKLAEYDQSFRQIIGSPEIDLSEEILVEPLQEEQEIQSEEFNVEQISTYTDCIIQLGSKMRKGEKYTEGEIEIYCQKLNIEFGKWIMDDIRSPLLLQFLHRNPLDFGGVCLDNGFFSPHYPISH